MLVKRLSLMENAMFVVRQIKNGKFCNFQVRLEITLTPTELR